MPSADPSAALHRLRSRPAVRAGLDVALAVGLGGYAALAALTGDEYPGTPVVAATLMALAGGVFVLRRSRPALAFTVSFGAMAALAVVSGPYQAGSSVLVGIVAAWSGMAYGVGWPLFVGVVAGYALLMSTDDLPRSLGSAVFVTLLLMLVGAAGRMARRLRELSAANVALRELVELESGARTEAARESERDRIARELHDILSHTLGVVALQTGAADVAWDSDPAQARQALRTARTLSLEALDQLRTLLHVVRGDDPAGAPVPTLDELDSLAERTTRAGFRVDLEVVGTRRAVAPQIQSSVYRVAQEGIANALKHSGTDGCALRLGYEPDCVRITVLDNGPGGRAGEGARLGLRGVAERVAVFGGRVRSGPRPSGGWELRADFPT